MLVGGDFDFERVDLTIFPFPHASWIDTKFSVRGTAKPAGSKLVDVDLDVEADAIDIDTIVEKLGGQKKAQDKKTASKYSIPVEGIAHFKTKRFKAGDYIIEPLQADVLFQENSIDIELKETALYGIPASATITVSPPGLSFQLKPEAHDQALNATLNCFVDDHFKADGTFNVTGVLKGHGAVSDLVKSTKGQLEISISDGHITIIFYCSMS